MLNPLLEVNPKIVLLNAKPVRTDLEAAPVGIYDFIRDDVREMSTVKPIDRIYVERVNDGYRGVLYSHGNPYLYAMNGNGFVAKPLDSDDPSVLTLCSRLEDEERVKTAQFDELRASEEQSEFNAEMDERYAGLNDTTATPEDAPPYTLEMHGPMVDSIERVPGSYRKMMQGAFLDRVSDKQTDGCCGGGVVLNREGKILLIKPRSGFGGYDWTFPKGFPTSGEAVQATAIREVSEETGLTCVIDRLIGRFTHNDGGVCEYFAMTALQEVPQVDGVEVEGALWVTLVEALDMLNDEVDVRILAMANQLMPTLVIKGGEHSGVMIALFIPKDVGTKLVVRGGEKVEDLHITLAYLGKQLSETQKKKVATVVRKFARVTSKFDVTLGGVGRFSASESSEGKDVIYLSVDSPQVDRAHDRLVKLLSDEGISVASNHGFTPHVTLAYVDVVEKTPLERFEPTHVSFDNIYVCVGDVNLPLPLMQPVVVKALPKMSDDQREEKNKKVGAKPIGAATKKLGAGGQVRYNYPGEKGGAKPGQPQPAQQQGAAPSGAPAQQEEQQELPHPDLQAPNPEQAPIAAEHPAKQDPNDGRAPDPTKPVTPKHTLNVLELCSALGIQRAVLQQIVARMTSKFGAQAQEKFASFMGTHMKDFAEEHGLHDDYWVLLFNVLTGKVPEGPPASQTQPGAEAAKLASKPATV